MPTLLPYKISCVPTYVLIMHLHLSSLQAKHYAILFFNLMGYLKLPLLNP